MRCVHELTELRKIAGLEGSHSVNRALAFAYYVGCTHESHLIGNCRFDFLELCLGEFCQGLQIGANSAKLLDCQLAFCYTCVVRTRIQFVRRVGVRNHHFHAFQLHRHELEIEGCAIEINSMVFFALSRSKLIHDAAIYACKLMLRKLTDFCQFGSVIACTKNVVESASGYYLNRSRRAESCTFRHIAPNEDIVTLLKLETALDILRNTAEGIVNPRVVWQRSKQVVERQTDDLRDLRHVERLEAKGFLVVGCKQQVGTERERARENMAAVVVGMFANQVNASR